MFLCEESRRSAYHINQLCDGEAKLDDDHVRYVWHRSGPLVVTDKELLEKLILSMGVGLLMAEDCRGQKRQTSQFVIKNRVDVCTPI